jgi:rSAM/selenodomain-associated transferase 1
MRTSPDPEKAQAASCGIAVMAKASTPGSSKTRLVPPLTPEEAARCNTAFLRDVADNILAVAAQAPVAGYMAFGPPAARPFFAETFPPEIGLIDAWYPSLGDCLLSTIMQLFALGHTSAIVLNADSPTLPTSLLVETVGLLTQPGDRVVLGPAEDGGYYLLGVKHAHGRLFQDIAWSTERVARQTLDRAGELRLPVHLLPSWYDVDDIRALKMLLAELFEDQPFTQDLPSNRPRHTLELMQLLLESSDLSDRLGIVASRRAAE